MVSLIVDFIGADIVFLRARPTVDILCSFFTYSISWNAFQFQPKLPKNCLLRIIQSEDKIKLFLVKQIVKNKNSDFHVIS